MMTHRGEERREEERRGEERRGEERRGEERRVEERNGEEKYFKFSRPKLITMSVIFNLLYSFLMVHI